MHAAGDAGPDLEGGHGDEYRRAVIPVAIGHDSDAQGEAREAWAYLYIGPLDRLRRIDGGHWTMRGA